MPELVVQLTLVILTLAAFVFVYQVVRQMQEGKLSAFGFSTVLLVVLIGWIATEVISDLTRSILGGFGRIAHFAVMMLFAATITLQLRRSSGK